MANTTNLDLEELTINDNLKTTFVNKLNINQNKIDDAYGTLRDGLLENTGKDNLVEAINSVAEMSETISELNEQVETLTENITALSSVGDATASDIVNGKVALVQGETVTGTAFSETTTATANDIASGKTAYDNTGSLITGNSTKLPTINVTATGSYVPTAGITNYGAGINKDGVLVIYAYSYSTAEEHYDFVPSSIQSGFGTIANGWNLTSTWDTSDNATHLEACTITEINVTSINEINITMNFSGISTNYDYVQCNITITYS